MKTDFPEKYITLGLKISYYRRKAGYTQEYAYRLFHNEDGFMYAYKSLEPRPDGLDPMYYIAKSKLRKI